MKIAVIIPLYNAANFIEKAVESALIQKEVAEIILVEDGSTDHSLAIALVLEQTHQSVQLYQHPNQENLGPSASRNLGIEKAKSPFVAFLDADDFYLPNRFSKTQDVFNKHIDAQGVYEAIGEYFYNKESEIFYKKLSPQSLTTVRQKDLTPEQLPFYLIGKPGHQIHLDGLTIKKAVIEQIGGFDTALKQVQDTDFIWRLCLNTRLYPGEIEKAVSMRGVHGNNATFDRTKAHFYKHLFAEKWFNKIVSEKWDRRINWAIFRTFLEVQASQKRFNSSFKKKCYKLILIIIYILKQPFLLIKFLI